MIGRQPARLLCVDDNDAVLKMLGVAFESAGYEVETARNGFLALQKVGEKIPNAINSS